MAHWLFTFKNTLSRTEVYIQTWLKYHRNVSTVNNISWSLKKTVRQRNVTGQHSKRTRTIANRPNTRLRTLRASIYERLFRNAARIWNTSYIAISLRKIIMLYMYRFSRTNVNILIIHVVQKSPALIKMTLMWNYEKSMLKCSTHIKLPSLW